MNKSYEIKSFVGLRRDLLHTVMRETFCAQSNKMRIHIKIGIM